MSNTIIIKSDGSHEPYDASKLVNHINEIGDVEESLVLDVIRDLEKQLPSELTTEELVGAFSDIAALKLKYGPDYNKVASTLIVGRLWNSCPSKFSGAVDLLYKNLSNNGGENPLVTKDLWEFVTLYKDIIDPMIQRDRDLNRDFFSLSTLRQKYLDKLSCGTTVFTPQYHLMRVALSVCSPTRQLMKMDETQLLEFWSEVRETYDATSLKRYTHATPTLYNAGTRSGQYSSCFLHTVEDSLTEGPHSIYKSALDMARVQSSGGGVGLYLGKIRSAGSYIRGTNGPSAGVMNLTTTFNANAGYITQGGKRKGSTAVYLPIWHPEVRTFIKMQQKTGDTENQRRNLNPAIVAYDLFFERVAANQDWSLFDPAKVPELNKATGTKWRQAYLHYESQGLAENKINARKLNDEIARAAFVSGHPYIINYDSINDLSMQAAGGPVLQSNLCAEIVQVTNPEETAVCNLASLADPAFVLPGKTLDPDAGVDQILEVINWGVLESTVRLAVRNLDRIIDNNNYYTESTLNSNKLWRPMGLGRQGTADMFHMLKIPFDSEAARLLDRLVQETVYYAAISESAGLARLHGPYPEFGSTKNCPYSQGKLHFDLQKARPVKTLGSRAPNVLPDEPLHPKLLNRWPALRQAVARGIRNSLLVANMPTASTAQILGNNECFEPYTYNFYNRKTLSGTFTIMNKYLYAELKALGFTKEQLEEVYSTPGASIQNNPLIPDDIKLRFRNVREIKQSHIMEMARNRQPFVDQSQSMNLYISSDAPIRKAVSSAQILGWALGLKTIRYYLHNQAIGPVEIKKKETTNKPAEQPNPDQLTPEEFNAMIDIAKARAEAGEDCDMCSG